MARAAAIVVLAVAVAAPAAASPPRDLSARYLEHTNVHIANEGGAIDRTADIRIAAALGDRGVLTVVETGQRGEHNLYPDYSTDDATTWTTRWTGTWRVAGDKLEWSLDVDAAKSSCKAARTVSDAAAETRPCAVASKHVAVTCEPSTVDDDDHAGHTLTVWSCSASDRDALGESSAMPWTFGRGACVAISGGMHDRYNYRRC